MHSDCLNISTFFSTQVDRLATEALKSYAEKFEPEQHPEDYKLVRSIIFVLSSIVLQVMRADVVEAELADEDESKYETLEDIELRKKNEKLEQKEKERKEKMREERLKRIQAFQAAALLKERSDEEDGGNDDSEEEDEEDEVVEEQEPAENPFYTSYKEAVEKEEELEDPLKEIREREKRKLEEDAEALRKLEEERLAQERRAATEPPQKKARTSSESESNKFSGVGAVAEMLAEEKERIGKELAEEEERVRRKEAEKVLRKGRKRGDPNNPTKEEVEAAQELEALTWQVLNQGIDGIGIRGVQCSFSGPICHEQEGSCGGHIKQDDKQGSCSNI